MPKYLFVPTNQVLKWLIRKIYPQTLEGKRLFLSVMCPQKCKHHTSCCTPKLTQSIQLFKYRQHPGNLPSFTAVTMQSNNRLSENHAAERLAILYSFGYYWCKDFLPACLTVWINRQVSLKFQILEGFFWGREVGGGLNGFLSFLKQFNAFNTFAFYQIKLDRHSKVPRTNQTFKGLKMKPQNILFPIKNLGSKLD